MKFPQHSECLGVICENETEKIILQYIFLTSYLLQKVVAFK